MLNEYNALAETYSKSSTKPDKLYSILPTVLDICRNRSSSPRTIFDLGCGNGFFTFALSEQYPSADVFGIDNSEKQIELAEEKLRAQEHHHIVFINEDIFEKGLWVDSQLVVAPFILGYKPLKDLDKFFADVYHSLTDKGTFVIVLDDIKGVDHTRFGAKKTYSEGKIKIELFDEHQQPIVILHAIFHHKESIVESLKKIGFRDIAFHEPIISDKGINRFGEQYWTGYKEEAESCYISCIK